MKGSIADLPFFSTSLSLPFFWRRRVSGGTEASAGLFSGECWWSRRRPVSAPYQRQFLQRHQRAAKTRVPPEDVRIVEQLRSKVQHRARSVITIINIYWLRYEVLFIHLNRDDPAVSASSGCIHFTIGRAGRGCGRIHQPFSAHHNPHGGHSPRIAQCYARAHFQSG